MRTAGHSSTVGSAASQRVVLRIGSFDAVIPIGAAAIAAASLVAGATSATYASSVSPERMGAAASRVVPLAREEDTRVTISDALGEIKRLGGLTWDNLARIFGVSRRTVHNWV